MLTGQKFPHRNNKVAVRLFTGRNSKPGGILKIEASPTGPKPYFCSHIIFKAASMKFFRTALLLLAPMYFFSCGTQQRLPNYLQNVSDTSINATVIVPELRIQKNDLLSILVYSSSTKPQISDAPYNLTQQTASSDGSSSSSVGYLVDVNGNIEYPQIGIVKAEGLTKLQLADEIKRKINEKDSVLTNPSVIIRFQNLRVTVLGEVNKEGPISIPGERVTILEAIGLAGGVKEYGQKDKVKVIRETDGKRQAGYVDLSSNSLFESPYYNLMQNDMIVVEPSGRKAKKADQEAAFRQAGFIVSLVTAIAVVVRVFQ
jgi:polysaccharide export outer membrane protein